MLLLRWPWQAKVNIGVKAQSVAFSPNGAHLAVGTVTGMLKVTQPPAAWHSVNSLEPGRARNLLITRRC